MFIIKYFIIIRCAYNCSPACAPGTAANPFPNCPIMN